MSVPTKSQVHAGNLWNTYVRAWAHGAAGKPLDPKFTSHKNQGLRQAYTDGYRNGRDARSAASHWAAERYCYEPSILRTSTTSNRCGVEGCRLVPDHVHKFDGNVP